MSSLQIHDKQFRRPTFYSAITPTALTILTIIDVVSTAHARHTRASVSSSLPSICTPQ
ncbi:hypothetical protein BDQ12DRAFT_684163 [Crucibulum laeve]|uniref:Uncharacterized protein n=1 Tax=Crucibulum laeve TaxID=68775 RepID=A0A5C3LZ32_9AGAR|nr:hypothetical protein BDQ12DRAFT_684163 [Crucibulum laeve]